MFLKTRHFYSSRRNGCDEEFYISILASAFALRRFGTRTFCTRHRFTIGLSSANPAIVHWTVDPFIDLKIFIIFTHLGVKQIRVLLAQELAIEPYVAVRIVI